jgi:hypothetical protein
VLIQSCSGKTAGNADKGCKALPQNSLPDD